MQPHQERVVAEKSELDAKLEKLDVFIGGETFAKLPEDEQMRLRSQSRVMQEYSDILGERIEAFAVV